MILDNVAQLPVAIRPASQKTFNDIDLFLLGLFLWPFVLRSVRGRGGTSDKDGEWEAA
jgi:hypothetical protein